MTAMEIAELNRVDELLEAEPVYVATCSLCHRGCFSDPRQRQEAFEAEHLVEGTTASWCPQCEQLLEQALLQANPYFQDLSPTASNQTLKQREAFAAVLAIGRGLEEAVNRLYRPRGRRGPKPQIALWFAAGLFFHSGFSDKDIQWLLESETGVERNKRHITRLRQESKLPITSSLRAAPLRRGRNLRHRIPV
jgi:hypothetical protein